jgi:hypothetical protein
MEKNTFEFKGVVYIKTGLGPSWQGSRVMGIRRADEVNSTTSPPITKKEHIPEHLRNLNKRQLRERVMLYEVLVKHQGQLLKELEKDRLV